MGWAAYHTTSSVLSARHRARWLSMSSWVSLRGEERVTGREGARPEHATPAFTPFLSAHHAPKSSWRESGDCALSWQNQGGGPPNQKGPFQTLLLGPRSPGRPEGLLDARSQAHLAPASETEENPMSESPE